MAPVDIVLSVLNVAVYVAAVVAGVLHRRSTRRLDQARQCVEAERQQLAQLHRECMGLFEFLARTRLTINGVRVYCSVRHGADGRPTIQFDAAPPPAPERLEDLPTRGIQ